MNMRTKFETRFLMGSVDGENVYLSAPSWDCGWYWGFGYLGNENRHYHVDGVAEKNNLWDALREHFGETLTITDEADLWTFCELMQTFYTLKKSAEVLGRGGSNYTENPVSDVIRNEDEAKRINEKIMPAIFDAIEDILKKYR